MSTTDTILADDGSVYRRLQGKAEGTSFHIIYQDEKGIDLQPDIIRLFDEFEQSLSVYIPHSLISRLNRNEPVEVDDFFHYVFTRAKEISKQTDGAFDISAEPLFRAWGFSSEEKNIPDENQIKHLKQFIGMDKVRLEGKLLVKDFPETVLNVNAIAKGYSADLLAALLAQSGSPNYLVEIGGEIRVKGVNPGGEIWRIGVDHPSENRRIPGEKLQVILQITDRGIATSGNYRQFYMEDRRKITHTIDPATGYPTEHNLVSVTIIADDAITADAYATACMVGGIEKAVHWIDRNPTLEAVFICREADEYRTYFTSALEGKVEQA